MSRSGVKISGHVTSQENIVNCPTYKQDGDLLVTADMILAHVKLVIRGLMHGRNI